MNNPETDNVETDAENASGREQELLDTLANGLAALRLFGSEMGFLTIQETADRLNLSRSAARRILVTLEHLGYLTQQGRRYHITAHVLEFGYSYISSLSLPELARPAMQALSARLEEQVALARLEEKDAVYIERVAARQPFRIDFSIGTRLPAYSFSVGQVLLSGLTDQELDDYFRTTPLKAITPLTITDESKLREIITAIRRDGYRFGLSDMMYGVGGIAVPIHNRAREIVAAMAVPIFHGRDQTQMIDTYLPVMLETAKEISSFIARSKDG